MKLKKISALALSLSMCLGTTGMANASESVNNQFFKDYESVASWEKITSQSESTFSGEISGEDHMSAGYKIKAEANQDAKNLRTYMELKFIPLTETTPAIPDVKIYVDGTDLYINKDAMNKFASLISPGKTFTKDFVKIDMTAGTKDSNLSEDMLKALKNNPTDITKKAIKFLKGIDLGINLGLEKQGNSYSISWNADKTVDVLNAYYNFFFSHPDYFLNFYKDVFGIDVNAMFKQSGMSKEEFNKSIKEFGEMWKQNVEPVLPAVKEALKGTQIDYKMTFEGDKFSSDLKCNIKIDANIIAKKLGVIGGANKKANSPIGAMNFSDIPRIDLVINSSQDAKKDDTLIINIPTNVETLDFSKLVPNSNIYMIYPEKSVISTIKPDGSTDEKSIKIESKNGKMSIDKKTFEEFTGMKVDSNKEMFEIRPYAEKNNLNIQWNQQEKVLIIIQK